MQFELPHRLSATGMIGLAALSATHWLRANLTYPGPIIRFALDVMPNLAAAFAMPLILASFRPSTSQSPITPASRLAYNWLLAFTTIGLCGWEIIQIRNSNFVFDINDILATGLGSILAYLAFTAHVKLFVIK